MRRWWRNPFLEMSLCTPLVKHLFYDVWKTLCQFAPIATVYARRILGSLDQPFDIFCSGGVYDHIPAAVSGTPNTDESLSAPRFR